MEAHTYKLNGEVGVVVLNGYSFATGLIWESSGGDTSEDIVTLAKERANQLGADLYCINEDQNQFGLGSTTARQSSKTSSLALTIQNNVSGNFLGLFELHDKNDDDERYYLVGIMNGQVVAGTDCVYDDRSHVESVCAELYYMSASAWEHVVVPASFSIENSVEEPITEFINNISKVRLKPVNEKGLKKKLIIGASILAVLGGCYYMYSHHESQIESKKILEDLKTAQNKREQDLRKKREFHVPAYPWENAPKGVNAIEACYSAIVNTPISYSGWKTTQVGCDGKNILLMLNRDGGTINWVNQNLIEYGKHAIMKYTSKGDIIISIPLDNFNNLPKYSRTSQTGVLDNEQLYLNTQFEEIFQKVDLKKEKGPTSEAVIDDKGTRASFVLYKDMMTSFKTNLSPVSYNNILKNISLLTLNSMTLDLSDWTWDIKVTSYEKVPLPGNVLVAPEDQNLKGNSGGSGSQALPPKVRELLEKQKVHQQATPAQGQPK